MFNNKFSGGKKLWVLVFVTCHGINSSTITDFRLWTWGHGIRKRGSQSALMNQDEPVSADNWNQSVQFSRVQLCDPMNCSTPDFLVHHQVPEHVQTHIHQVSDAIQPSHPLSPSFPPAFNLSQNQGHFQWVSSSHFFFHYCNSGKMRRVTIWHEATLSVAKKKKRGERCIMQGAELQHIFFFTLNSFLIMVLAICIYFLELFVFAT